MSSDIILFKTQQSRKTVYSHECAPWTSYCYETVPCRITYGIRDPTLDTKTCAVGLCPPQLQCLKPDKTEAYIGLSSQGVDPLVHFGWDIKPPDLVCIYDADHIDTDAQLNNLKKLFQPNQLNHAMRLLCTDKPGSICKDAKKTCSRFKSFDSIGRRCQEWLDTVTISEVKDSIRREYCLHFDTDDCSCINRTKRQDFNTLKNGMDATTIASSKCWYKPCDDNDNILLDVDQQNICNPTICQNIINAHANGSINIENNTSSLSCNFTKQQIDTVFASKMYDDVYLIVSLIFVSIIIIITCRRSTF
jgi:hypothetical protein